MVVRRPRDLGISRLALKSIGRCCAVMHGPMIIASTTSAAASMGYGDEAFTCLRLFSEQVFRPSIQQQIAVARPMGRHVIRQRHGQCFYLVGNNRPGLGGRLTTVSRSPVDKHRYRLLLLLTEWLLSDDEGATGIAVVEWLSPRRPVASLQYEE